MNARSMAMTDATLPDRHRGNPRGYGCITSRRASAAPRPRRRPQDGIGLGFPSGLPLFAASTIAVSEAGVSAGLPPPKTFLPLSRMVGVELKPESLKAASDFLIQFS